MGVSYSRLEKWIGVEGWGIRLSVSLLLLEMGLEYVLSFIYSVFYLLRSAIIIPFLYTHHLIIII